MLQRQQQQCDFYLDVGNSSSSEMVLQQMQAETATERLESSILYVRLLEGSH